MKLFPSKQKHQGAPKQPKGRPWALSRVLCRSQKEKRIAAPPPVPTTVATRRTTARTKSATRAAIQRNNSTTLLLEEHAQNDMVDRDYWVPQQVPFDEIRKDHMTAHNNRRSIVGTTTTTNSDNNNGEQRTRPIPNQTKPAPNLKSSLDSKRSEGTSSSCTTSLLDDTTLGSLSSGTDSTLMDTTAIVQQDGCQGCEDGNRDLSLFLCGKILDQAGLRTPQDTEDEREAWDELILDLLLA
ncbi:unnamed protein product [Cylindrotheca closterium]|uniref:Uncharacterized protein n=1 Tax=Cylindrotheca closterium TaxID=2856 RepID=A0AAD2CS56_9STRA|nr:unnamed protein product [Cylindrotheca closterium]